MDREEIKQMYSMTDVVQRYGFRPNRSGFICCPFHTGDRTASMKLYPDSFYCFACGAAGDIFTFVQRIENKGFKDAFLSLGGKYPDHGGKPAYAPKTMTERHQETRERLLTRQAEERKKQLKHSVVREELRKASRYAGIMATGVRELEPFSNDWCFCANELEPALYRFECLREEVKKWSK